MDKVVSNFKNSLVINSVDILQDYAEIGIDSFIDNEIVKSIPIIKSVVSARRIINSISDRKLLRNMAIFIIELNSGNVNKEKLEKHIKSLEDSKKAEKELGRFLMILDQTIDAEKSALYAKIYKAYINQKINWELVTEFTEIVSRLFLQDLNILKDLYSNKKFITSNLNEDRKNQFRIERLYSLGIIGYSAKALFPGGGAENYVNLNEIGKLFAKVIFE